MSIETIWQRLSGAAAVTFVSSEAEASAARVLRGAIGELLRASEKRDYEAGLAVAELMVGRPLKALGVRTRQQRRQLVARGLRRLRSNPEVREVLASAQTNRCWLPSRRPGGGWITIAQTADLTGYSIDHIRGWILPNHPEIRRRKCRTRAYLCKRDVLRYAKKQRRRGYGPRRKTTR